MLSSRLQAMFSQEESRQCPSDTARYKLARSLLEGGQQAVDDSEGLYILADLSKQLMKSMSMECAYGMSHQVSFSLLPTADNDFWGKVFPPAAKEKKSSASRKNPFRQGLNPSASEPIPAEAIAWNGLQCLVLFREGLEVPWSTILNLRQLTDLHVRAIVVEATHVALQMEALRHCIHRVLPK